jgi:hypothetical protein
MPTSQEAINPTKGSQITMSQTTDPPAVDIQSQCLRLTRSHGNDADTIGLRENPDPSVILEGGSRNSDRTIYGGAMGGYVVVCLDLDGEPLNAVHFHSTQCNSTTTTSASNWQCSAAPSKCSRPARRH